MSESTKEVDGYSQLQNLKNFLFVGWFIVELWSASKDLGPILPTVVCLSSQRRTFLQLTQVLFIKRGNNFLSFLLSFLFEQSSRFDCKFGRFGCFRLLLLVPESNRRWFKEQRLCLWSHMTSVLWCLRNEKKGQQIDTRDEQIQTTKARFQDLPLKSSKAGACDSISAE